MTNAAQFFVRQQLLRHAQECAAAAARISRFERLQDVVRAADVRPPSVVASVAHLVPESKHLRSAAERQIERICKGQIDDLQAIVESGDRDEFGQALGRYRQEWQFLRGTFAMQLQRIEREAQRVQSELERRAPTPQRPRE